MDRPGVGVTKTSTATIQAWMDARIDEGFSITECLIWPFARGHGGYGVIHDPRVGHMVQAARIMWEKWTGEPWPEDKPTVGHFARNCGSSGCCSPIHARPQDWHEQAADRIRLGNVARGERSGSSKLTAEAVAAIRKREAAGESHKDLAEEYEVAKSTVEHVVTGRSWGWLDPEQIAANREARAERIAEQRAVKWERQRERDRAYYEKNREEILARRRAAYAARGRGN